MFGSMPIQCRKENKKTTGYEREGSNRNVVNSSPPGRDCACREKAQDKKNVRFPK